MKKTDDQIEIKFWYVPGGTAVRDENLAKKMFETLKIQRMLVPPGKRFICQEVYIHEDEDDILGCFLDKDEYSVHWFHESLKKLKVGQTYQSIGTRP